jgi:hypothetical protein
MTRLIKYAAAFFVTLSAVIVSIVWFYHCKIPPHLSTPMLSVPEIISECKHVTAKWTDIREEAQAQEEFCFKLHGQWKEGLELFPVAVGVVQALGSSVRNASLKRIRTMQCSGSYWRGTVRVMLPLTATHDAHLIVGKQDRKHHVWRNGEPMVFDPSYPHEAIVTGDSCLFLILDILRPEFPSWLESLHENI